MDIFTAVKRLKEALEIIDQHDLPMAGIHVTNAIQMIEAALDENAPGITSSHVGGKTRLH